jgi:hypothetical protein
MTDELIKFARKYRTVAAAALVQIVSDESAPAAARISAAERILSYSDGRPGQARPVTVADIARMDDDQRFELLNALVQHYWPAGVNALIAAAVDEAFKQQAPALPFVRGAPASPASLPTPPVNSAHRPRQHTAGRAPAVAGEGYHPQPKPLAVPADRVSEAVAVSPPAPPPPALVPSAPVAKPPPTHSLRGHGLIGDMPIDQNPRDLLDGHHAPGTVGLLNGYERARWKSRS